MYTRFTHLLGRFVAWHYFHTSFAFDAFTSVPVAVIEYVVRLSVCTGNLEGMRAARGG